MPVLQKTKLHVEFTSFSSFRSPLSVAAAPGFPSEMSPTLSRPAVGPLEMKLILLARFGNLTPKKQKRQEMFLATKADVTTFFQLLQYIDKSRD